MLSSTRHFLSTPYPYCPTFGRSLKNALIAGCIVAFVLLLYRPFGIHSIRIDYLWLKIAGFGLPCMIPILLIGVLKQFWLNKYVVKKRWSIGFEMLLWVPMLLLIGIFNVAYLWLISEFNFSLATAFRMELYTFLIGMIPCMFILLKEQFFAANIQSMLERPTLLDPDQSLDAKVFELKTEREAIEINPENLCLIKAEGNYVEVVQCLPESKVSTDLIRMPLKEAQQKLIEQGLNLPKCHRSYLVNTKQIARIEGNAQGLILHLNRGRLKVPVSRSYVAKFR